MDIDLESIDGPSKVPARRPARFLPKAALKSQPQPPAKPRQEPQLELPETQKPIVKEEDPKALVVDATDEKVKETSPGPGPGPEPEPKPMEVEESREDLLQLDNVAEEEDPVVREIDVYFNPSLADANSKLHVMQYPLRPDWRPYELDERCVEVRVKPKTSEFEVDISLDLENNYDQNVAEKKRITKQTLVTAWKHPKTTGYAVGVLTGNKLHLNLVDGVVQLRPTTRHLDSDPLQKKVVAQNAEVAAKSAESTKKEQGAANVDNTSQDDWVSLAYHSTDSSFSSTYRQKLIYEDTSPIQFSMKPSDYLNSLCPGKERNLDKHILKKSVLSLPLEKRFEKWFSEGPQVNRFCSLKHLAPEVTNEAVLLAEIERHAFLVQGLWVSRSSVLNLPGNEALARDYLLLLFKKNMVISTTKVYEFRNIAKAMNYYVGLFATKRDSFQDYKFKAPTDFEFIKGHHDVVQKQETEWQNLEKKVMNVLQKPTSGAMIRHSSNTDMPRSSLSANLSIDGASGSGAVTMPDEVREITMRAVHELLRKHHVCSSKLISESLRENAVLRSNVLNADARGAVAIAREADVQAVISQAVSSQVAAKIHGVYILKSLGDTLDPLRSVVIDLFSAKEVNAKLKKGDIVEAARIRLKRDISNKEYTQVLNQLCVSVKGNAWVLRSGDGNPGPI